MTFKKYIKDYLIFLSKASIFIMCGIFMILPIILGIILATFVSPYWMGLMLLILITAPLGFYGILKMLN